MKNPFSEAKRSYYMIGLIALYVVGIPFGSRFIHAGIWLAGIFLVGIFYILLTLISLDNWDKKKLFLILSPIVTYPLYLIVVNRLADFIAFGLLELERWRTLSDMFLFVFVAYFPYAVIYAFLWGKFWTWIDPKRKKNLLIGFMIITIFFFVFTKIGLTCERDNFVNGKGVGIYATECDLVGLYQPHDGGDRAKALYFFWGAIINSSAEPLLIMSLLILNYLLSLRIKPKIGMKR